MAERANFREMLLRALSRVLYPFQGTNAVLMAQTSPLIELVSFGTIDKTLSIFFLSLRLKRYPLFQPQTYFGGRGLRGGASPGVATRPLERLDFRLKLERTPDFSLKSV